MDYQKQAQDFADMYGVKLEILDVAYRKHFSDDAQPRYVFKCKLKRGRKSYTFNFGQSISAGGEEPTMYDVLSCITKYDPDSFEYFCAEFGYDTDSRNAEKVWKAVTKEWEAVDRLFPEEVMNDLREIV